MTNAAPRPLLSATTRFATAVAVCGFVSLAWITAGNESHDAVQASAAVIANGPAGAASHVIAGGNAPGASRS